jgi:hypothetical protein
MKKLLVICVLACISMHSTAYEKRDLLQGKAGQVDLAGVLIKDFSELNFPDYGSREFWNALPETLRNQYIENAEGFLHYDWPIVKATDYLEIIRSGDRKQEVYAAPRAALVSLVMGELTEGKGRFIDQIVNGAWYYSEQTWWGWSAHLTAQKAPHGLPDADEPVIDLGVGEIANILSWTWFLFKDEFDKIHPLIATRLRNEIMKKVVVPYYERNDFWWQGFDGSRHVNNWNPWTNHNVLTAILILENDAQKRLDGVNKVIRSLDEFVNVYPDDGGCDEGPSYWGRAGASLYQSLDLLKRATGNSFDVYDNQLIQNMGSYIYKAYIEYPYFINFADADATTGSRPQIIYSYGKDIADPVMQKFGVFLAEKQGLGMKLPIGKIDEQIMELTFLGEMLSTKSENALIADFWLPQTEVAGARDKAGSSQGFFFAAKGGHNAESHNHNDLGTFVLYYNGKPAFIDIGRETYTAKTFSSRRYEIWTMQSQYHNLPKINGVDQMQGRNFMAKNSDFKVNAKRALFSTDIAGAYPENAGVKTWVRSCQLDRGKQFTIRDTYELNQLRDEPTTANFVTYCKVSELKPGILHLEGEEFRLEMQYNTRLLKPEIEFYEVTDAGLKRYWPDGITRIVFSIINPQLKGKHDFVIKPLP